jgi:hypothetical protein
MDNKNSIFIGTIFFFGKTQQHANQMAKSIDKQKKTEQKIGKKTTLLSSNNKTTHFFYC